MSVKSPERLTKHISGWMRDYAIKAGIKTLILGLSGGVDSALVALLCKQTALPLVCVNMPCHSSSSAYDRAKAFATDYGLDLIKIDISGAHNIIHEQVKALNDSRFEGNNIAIGGLRSCLRAPTLSFFANATRGLIVGTGNRSEDNITRYFQKYGDGCVDISPIADLFKGEVYELFSFLTKGEWSGGRMMSAGAQAIYDAKPTADLWGPDSGQEDEKELGITYDEIEWADREDMRSKLLPSTVDKTIVCNAPGGIIFGDADPAKIPDFWKYTARQQQVICRLHQLEKISRHKVNANLPVCRVRQIEGLLT